MLEIIISNTYHNNKRLFNCQRFHVILRHTPISFLAESGVALRTLVP